jgi:hypothetical protein
MRLTIVSVLIAIAFSLLPATYLAQPVLTGAGQECAQAHVSGGPACNCPTERTPRAPVPAPILLAEDQPVYQAAQKWIGRAADTR